jgi:hypothetical protein
MEPKYNAPTKARPTSVRNSPKSARRPRPRCPQKSAGMKTVLGYAHHKHAVLIDTVYVLEMRGDVARAVL